MSIYIGQVEFLGPFGEYDGIEAQPGIYGILCQTGEEFELIDLEESACVRNCFESEEYVNNMLFYAENCGGKLSSIVHYTPHLSHAQRVELKYDLLGSLNEVE